MNPTRQSSSNPVLPVATSRIALLLGMFTCISCTDESGSGGGDPVPDAGSSTDGTHNGTQPLDSTQTASSTQADASAIGSTEREASDAGASSAPHANTSSAPATESTSVSPALSSDELGAPQLDGRCDQVGQRACNGPAQDQLLICSQTNWVANGVCDVGQHCNQESGRCSPVPDVCNDATSETSYCDGAKRMICGEDLLGVVVETCPDLCETIADAATCVAPGSDAAISTPYADAGDSGAQSDIPTETSAPSVTGESSEPFDASVPVVVDPNNLLTNASFESGVGDWTVVGGAILVTSAAASNTGDKSLECTGRTQAWEGPALEVLPLLQPGQLYVASGWVRSADATGQPFHIVRRAACLTDAGPETETSQIYVQLASTYTDDQWTRIETPPFMLPDCDLDSFLVYFEGPAAGKAFYLDDVSIVPFE